MMHYSNGATTLPNLGLNTFTINTGISYALGEKKELLPPKEIKLNKKIQFNPFIYGGWRENTIHKPVKYGVGVLSFEFLKRINRKGNLLFGVDAVYNSSVEHFDELEHLIENEDYLKKGSNFQSGIFVGYNLLFDDVSLVLQQGLYTYNQYKERGLLYNRIAIRKQFGEKLTASIGLKSHIAVAEYLEIGFGYRFK